MRQYVVRRLLLFVPTLFGASLLVFVLMRLVPGRHRRDPRLPDRLRVERHPEEADRADPARSWGSTGRSSSSISAGWRARCAATSASRIRSAGPFGTSSPNAFRAPWSWPCSPSSSPSLWAVPLGVISAVKQNGWMDYIARIVSLSGLSPPPLRDGGAHPVGSRPALPLDPAARVRRLHENPLENLKQLIWPALCSGLLHQRPHHPAHALADAGGDPPRLRAHRTRQGPRRARGGLSARAQATPCCPW